MQPVSDRMGFKPRGLAQNPGCTSNLQKNCWHLHELSFCGAVMQFCKFLAVIQFVVLKWPSFKTRPESWVFMVTPLHGLLGVWICWGHSAFGEIRQWIPCWLAKAHWTRPYVMLRVAQERPELTTPAPGGWHVVGRWGCGKDGPLLGLSRTSL